MAGTERYGSGRITIDDYDQAWPRMFEQERVRLYGALGSMVSRIEHVGSTAVPGLAAKPIIDVLVGVHNLEESRSRSIVPLDALGYTYMSEYESWLPGEMLFRKAVFGPWTHHAHLMEQSSPRWDEFILIRDYLRRHTEAAEEYARLKRALALEFDDDISGFRDAKRPFLQALMERARLEAR
ncbi:MAG TPA: GrpB family protein [Chloroflexota bacterium]